MKNFLDEKVSFMLILTLLGLNCAEKKSSSVNTLIPLVALASANSRAVSNSSTSTSTSTSTFTTVYGLTPDIYGRTIPGSSISVNGNSLSDDTSVTVNGTAAVVSKSGGIFKFSVPDLGLTSAQTVTARIISGTNVFEKTFTYQPLRALTLNSGTVSGTFSSSSGAESNSHFFKFTSSTANLLINTSGYTGADLDFYIYTSPSTLSYYASKAGTATNAEVYKSTAFPAGTYYLKVVPYSANNTNYKLGIADNVMTSGGSCVFSANLCGDYISTDSSAQADCTGAGGTWNGSTLCAGRGMAGTIVGKCIMSSVSNLGTGYYYSGGFNATTAQNACTTSNSTNPNFFMN